MAKAAVRSALNRSREAFGTGIFSFPTMSLKTSARMGQAPRACVLGCSARDDLPHYLERPLLLRASTHAGGGAFPLFGVGAPGTEPLGKPVAVAAELVDRVARTRTPKEVMALEEAGRPRQKGPPGLRAQRLSCCRARACACAGGECAAPPKHVRTHQHWPCPCGFTGNFRDREPCKKCRVPKGAPEDPPTPRVAPVRGGHHVGGGQQGVGAGDRLPKRTPRLVS